jgi:hypothetical protein
LGHPAHRYHAGIRIHDPLVESPDILTIRPRRSTFSHEVRTSN